MSSHRIVSKETTSAAVLAAAFVAGTAFVAPGHSVGVPPRGLDLISTPGAQDARPQTSFSSAATAGVALGAACFAAAAVRRHSDVQARGQQVIVHSGARSPGYNTLPETEKRFFAFEGVTGDQAPLGYWDPLGLAFDKTSSEFPTVDVAKFIRRREVELKHGRVAMFATIGYIVPEYYRFPGVISTSANIKFTDIPNGLKALSVVPKEGIAQFFAFIAFIELYVNKPTGEPGNYGKGFLGLGTLGLGGSIQDKDVRVTKLNAELANGRLAMMAIIGMFFQDGLTGSAWGDWALYTDSPLR